MGKALLLLLLLKVELSLLRWCLGARQSRAGRVSFLGDRRHWVRARAIHLAIHLAVRDGARVDEARWIVHSILRRLEVHGARWRWEVGGQNEGVWPWPWRKRERGWD